MKSRIHPFILLILFLAFSCQQPTKPGQQETKAELPPTGNFGESVKTEKAIPANQVASLFDSSDTIEVTLSGNIKASCKHTGCWMDFDMGNEKRLHVTFLDEKFTIPLDAAGKNAIAQGTAVRQLIPVETLRNYAREDGKSEEEIATITEPEWVYEMIATGVLIEE